MSTPISYKTSGVDIDVADATKRNMAKSLATKDPRVLNQIGAFASLFDGKFPNMKDPILVLKMEEPGSKQKLAFERGLVRSVCFDMINHLINDIVVMGATPLAVQDAVICGKLEQKVVEEIVQSVADACREQECSLVGGETSEQPGVLAPGTYVLTASIVGVVDKSSVIDGSRIAEGDTVIAVQSSGLHTNGYSLVRALMARDPLLENSPVGKETFIEAIMRPHRCYYQPLKGLFTEPGLHGLAHITGGGIEGNLCRIIPRGLCAQVDVSRLRVSEVFKVIQRRGDVSQADMLKTFNLGAGLVAVCAPQSASRIISAFAEHGIEAYPVGVVEKASESKPIRLTGDLER
jgi:phosphoribosylformylglycinamidine cyclo-ligase